MKKDIVDKEMSVYLAGKITKNGWRNELVDPNTLGRTDWASEVRDSDSVLPGWETVENALGEGIHLTGPFFVGCDHGCGHGPGSHGITGGCIGGTASQEATVRLCLDAIDRSDVIFAWVNTTDAYGTLIEVGYAKAKGKRIVVAHPPETFVRGKADAGDTASRSDTWFLNTIADIEIAEHSAEAAWKLFLDMEGPFQPLG